MELAPFLNYLSDYGYPALFILIFLGGAYVPIPTGIILIAVGALAREGYFNPTLALLVTIAASIAADFLVYSLARRFGRNEKLRAFFQRGKYGTQIKGYLEKYPALTIFITRIVGFITTPANALAGLSRLPLRKFIPADVIGNVIADGVYLAVGFFIGGALLSNPKEGIGIVAIVLLALIVLGGLGYLLFRTKKK